jgi:hypothetical protein
MYVTTICLIFARFSAGNLPLRVRRSNPSQGLSALSALSAHIFGPESEGKPCNMINVGGREIIKI